MHWFPRWTRSFCILTLLVVCPCSHVIHVYLPIYQLVCTVFPPKCNMKTRSLFVGVSRAPGWYVHQPHKSYGTTSKGDWFIQLPWESLAALKVSLHELVSHYNMPIPKHEIVIGKINRYHSSTVSSQYHHSVVHHI